jgi:lysozyme
MNDCAKNLEKRFEGFSPVPYRCPAGYWTIGYGTLCQKEHPPITRKEADILLNQATESAASHALRLSPVLVNYPDRLCAITDFIYNLGPTRYAASTLRKCVNRGDWSEAQRQIQRWVYGGGRKLPGLVTRRAVEAGLLA